MSYPTVLLCVDRKSLAVVEVAIQPSEINTSGWLAAVRFEGVTIQTHWDASPEDLATTLDRLAGEIRARATKAIRESAA